jgi:aryl-alcohol dehydrogenase-like predicted oxidoreductase
MEKRILGKTGMEVSVLGFGGSEIGFQKSPQENVSRLLNAALDAGLNVVDTAECYTGGPDQASSEELIGGAIGHRRNDFFLFTKCGHASGFDGAEDWDIKMLEQSIDRSLKRLKTDTVDLLQLHGCPEALLRKGDVIDVLHRARTAGKCRFIGYSGDNEAALYAVTTCPFDTLQTSINIADQSVLDTILPSAIYNSIGVIAKRPIANVAWGSGDAPPTNSYLQSYYDRLRVLHYPFLATPDAVATALRFTLSTAGVHTAIVGTQNPDRWAQNARLLDDGPLSESDIEAIRSRWANERRPDWVGQG